MTLPPSAVTKFARIDGNSDSGGQVGGHSVPASLPMLSAGRTDFHTGNVVNPKVDVKHFYPVGTSQDWSKLIGINTPVIVKNDNTIKWHTRSTIFGNNNIHASMPMDPHHFNAKIANEFVAEVNARAAEIRKTIPGGVVVPFDLCYDPNEIMARIACEWKLAGINFVETPPAFMTGHVQRPNERCIAARIRGKEDCKNYWDESVHGGFSIFFVLKFVNFKNTHRPIIRYAERASEIITEFSTDVSTTQPFYFPQLVAQYDVNSFLPLKDQKFQMEYRPDLNGGHKRTFMGLPLYVGMVFHNPEFKRSEAEVPLKNIPIANNLVVEARMPLLVQALMF